MRWMQFQNLLPAMKAIAEQSKAMKLATSVGTAIDALQHSSTIQTLGELAIVANVPNYTFKNPLLKSSQFRDDGDAPVFQ